MVLGASKRETQLGISILSNLLPRRYGQVAEWIFYKLGTPEEEDQVGDWLLIQFVA